MLGVCFYVSVFNVYIPHIQTVKNARATYLMVSGKFMKQRQVRDSERKWLSNTRRAKEDKRRVDK